MLQNELESAFKQLNGAREQLQQSQAQASQLAESEVRLVHESSTIKNQVIELQAQLSTSANQLQEAVTSSMVHFNFFIIKRVLFLQRLYFIVNYVTQTREDAFKEKVETLQTANMVFN
jgi:predicted nuclease with TOPRIM domain